MSDTSNSFHRLWEQIKLYLSARLESTKLTMAEKVTVLATTAALAMLGILFFVVILFFISVGLAHLLSEAIGPVWSYFIIAGAYLVLMLLVILLRRPLIMNPLARFLTRLIFTK